MTIQKSLQDDTLTVTLEGRLDTLTSPDLERALNDLADIDHLIIDFSGVSYISSAGLRVLLSLQKRMSDGKDMVVKNVQSAVLEVFDMAGFTDILTIV